MAETIKVLGQSAPSATTDTDLYTVPGASSAIISTIVIANRDNADATYNIAVRPSGATIANEHYLAFNVTVGGNDSTSLTLGITMASTDVLTVQASNDNLTFNAFGSEIS